MSKICQSIKFLVCQIRFFFLFIPNISHTALCLCHIEFWNGFYVVIIIVVIIFQVFCPGVVCTEQEKLQNKSNQTAGRRPDQNHRECNLYIQCQASGNHNNRIGNRTCHNGNLPCIVRTAVADRIDKKYSQCAGDQNQQHFLIAEEAVEKFLYDCRDLRCFRRMKQRLHFSVNHVAHIVDNDTAGC